MSTIQKGYADTPNGQIHYRQIRQAGGIPLVLLHQTASSSSMFEALMTTLADKFHTIAPDTPGFGNSFTPPSNFDLEFLASALHTALRALGVTSCFLFGHHTGAALAVQMASKHPQMVRKLILSGPPLLNEGQKERLKASLRPFALREDGTHLTQTWQRIRERAPSLPLEIVQRETLLNQWAGTAAQQAYQAVFDQPLGEQLSTLNIPALVMAGEQDTLRASLEPSYALLKQGALQILPGEGPYLCDQNPQAVAQAIESFLTVP
ncbi:MAG: hypothetical protein Fur0016_03020 [Anaerolineales bacterium]